MGDPDQLVDYVLAAAGGGGPRYVSATDHIALSQHVPDEFPYVDFRRVAEREIEPMAAVIEEFVHRAQMGTTHFGLAFRLACLLQTCMVFEVLAVMAERPQMRLRVPWLEQSSVDDKVDGLLDDLRALDVLKRFLFGLPLPPGDPNDLVYESLRRAKLLFEARAPVWLGHFSTFGVEQLYDEAGRNHHRSTRGVLESHASAYAFALLERSVPSELREQVLAVAASTRRGLYRTVEDLAYSLDQPVALDLGAVLRLGDYALDGKLFHVRTIPTPEDYVEGALPYARYQGLMGRFRRTGDAMRSLGMPHPTLEDQVEVLIGVHGDHRGVVGDEEPMREARQIQLEADRAAVDEWLRTALADDTLAAAPRLLHHEIAAATDRFLEGVLSYVPDERKFDPATGALAKLCAIGDRVPIEYDDGFEVFLCEPQAIDDEDVTFRAVIHALTSVATAILGRDAAQVQARSAQLERLGLASVGDVADLTNVDADRFIG